MRWSRLLLCVGVAGMIGVSVFGQSKFGATEEEPIRAAEPFGAEDFAAEEFAPVDELQRHEIDHPEEPALSPVTEDVVEEEQALRRQYLQLIEQKSGLMDRAALREAISRAEKDIDELKADDKLQEARQLLLELVKSHPQSKAAQAARVMLQAAPVEGDGEQFFNAPVPTPAYDGGERMKDNRIQLNSYESPKNSRIAEPTLFEQ